MKKLMLVLLALVAVFAIGASPATAGEIHGIVVLAADDSPVVGAMVEVHGMDIVRGQRPFAVRVQSDRAGKFVVEDVPAGNYLVKAAARQVGFGMAKVVVGDDPVRVAVKIGMPEGERPEPEFGSLIGKVVDADGNAVPGAKVVLMRNGANDRNARGFRALEKMTDRRGNFAFEKLPAGKYVIGASARRAGAVRERIEIIVDEPGEVTLTLKPIQRRGDDNPGGGRGDG